MKYCLKIENYNEKYFTIWSREVVSMIENCEDGWEKMVPKLVAKRVKEKSLFGHFCKIKKRGQTTSQTEHF